MIRREQPAQLAQALMGILNAIKQQKMQEEAERGFRGAFNQTPSMAPSSTIDVGGMPAQLQRFQGVESQPNYQMLAQLMASSNPMLAQKSANFIGGQKAIESLQPQYNFANTSGGLYATNSKSGMATRVPGSEPQERMAPPRSLKEMETGKTRKDAGGTLLKEVLDVDPTNMRPISGAQPRWVPWQAPKSDEGPPMIGGGKTGKDLLGALPESVKYVVKGIADGSVKPGDALSFRGVGPYSKTYIMNLVKQYNPTYDEKWVTSMRALSKDATTGRIARFATSMNMTVGHLDTFSQAADAIDNMAVRAGNTATNWVKNNLGKPEVTALQQSMKAVTSELAGLLKAGVGTASPTDQEMKEWESIVSLSSSPAQYQQFIDTALHLIASRMESLQHQAAPVSKPEGFSLVSPKAREILDRFGLDVERFEGGATTGTQRFIVNGKPYSIPANEVQEFLKDFPNAKRQ